MQIHVLAFEGPDAYARAGGLASRMEGLTEGLKNRENDIHLWFVGDPDAPYEEQRGALHLHRGCQPISRFHPACTGCSGEDYAVPGQNAIVLETGDPREFIGLYERLRSNPREHRALRRVGRATARRYSWPAIVDGVLLPRIELQRPRRAQADSCSSPVP